MYRDNTKVIKIGNKVIGGGNNILIQSMTNTKTEDVEATVNQIKELTVAGCDINHDIENAALRDVALDQVFDGNYEGYDLIVV